MSADEVINRLASEAEPHRRFHAVPAGFAGYARGRPPKQFAIPVHACAPIKSQDLNEWSTKLLAAMREHRGHQDPNTDQQAKGLQTNLVVDRDTASRLGLSAQQIDDALYDAFGQRQVSTMYKSINQYHVVMEVDPEFQQSPNR